MPIDYARLKNRPFKDVESTYSHSDTMLYALSVGLGSDPTDAGQLKFVYEEGLKALPTMSLVLADPGFWLREPDTGIDWPQVLYGEVGMELHAPLPACTAVIGKTTINEIVDKGPGKGALIYTTRRVVERDSGKLLCTLDSTYFCRTDGGFGGASGPTRVPHALPERHCDEVCDLRTLRQSALLYRLTGDFNPLHVDPAVAGRAGFDRPILHGLCTFGVAGHALLKTLCHYEADRTIRMRARFSKPVFPGETVRTEIWREGRGRAGFRCRALERNTVVLDNGFYEYHED